MDLEVLVFEEAPLVLDELHELVAASVESWFGPRLRLQSYSKSSSPSCEHRFEVASVEGVDRLADHLDVRGLGLGGRAHAVAFQPSRSRTARDIAATIRS